LAGGCFRLRGEVRPLTARDASELHRLYSAIKEGLAGKCVVSEAGGSVVGSCGGAPGFVVAVWLEPPAISHAGIEAVIGFAVEAANADDVLRGFKFVADAVAGLTPFKFIVRLTP